MISKSEAQTEALGAQLAQDLRPGDIVWLRGDLGAGKTAFVRGLARGLGIADRVTSPTFALVSEYEGRCRLFHFDLYRLSGWDELYDIGWDDYTARGGICAVEWSERLAPLPPGFTVALRQMGDGVRDISITTAEGEAWQP